MTQGAKASRGHVGLCPGSLPPDVKTSSLEETLTLGKTEARRRRGPQRTRRLDGIIGSMGASLGKLREMVKDREAWRAVVHQVAELDMTLRLNNDSCKQGTSEFSPVNWRSQRLGRFPPDSSPRPPASPP